MTKIRVTNGFHDGTGGVLLTGTLLEGDININDRLILEDGFEVLIMDVEKVPTAPGGPMIVMSMPKNLNGVIVWHTLYGKTFNVKNN